MKTGIFYFYDINENNIQWTQIAEVVDGLDCRRYSVSTHGDIFDLYTNKPVNKTLDKNGYEIVSLKDINGFVLKSRIRVHRAILLSFVYIPNFKEMQVNHIDGIHNHNWLSNLEWVTPKENSQHAMQTGLHVMHGEKNPNNKLTRDQVVEICKLIELGKYHDTEIAEMFGVTYTNISDIHNGKIWKEVSCNFDMSIKTAAHKFLKEDIEKICEDIQSGEYTYTQIAKKYNTTAVEIRAIIDGEIWKDVSCNYDLTVPQANHDIDKATARKVFEMIESGNYSEITISKTLGVTPYMVKILKRGKIYPEIAAEYDLTKPYKNETRSLSEEDIIDICYKIKSGMKDSEIAKLYNTYQQLIGNIRRGNTYKELSKHILNFDK